MLGEFFHNINNYSLVIYYEKLCVCLYMCICTYVIFLNWDNLFYYICKHHSVILGNPIWAERKKTMEN